MVALPRGHWLIGGGMHLGRSAHVIAIDIWRKRSVPVWPVDAAAAQPGRSTGRREGDAGCPGPPDPAGLSLNGLALRPLRDAQALLYAVNTGDRRAVEIFAVSAGAGVPRLAWRGCIPMPAHVMPNAVAPLPGGGLVISNFYNPDDPAAWARMDQGVSMGQVLAWSARTGLHPIDVGPVSGPNGLETSRDGRWLYVSDWGGRHLVIVDLRRGTRSRLSLPFLPDNLRRLADGTIMIAGQATRPLAIAACTQASCPQPWAVARYEPRSRRLSLVTRQPGSSVMNYVTTALRVDGTLYLTGRGEGQILYSADPLPP